VLLVETDVLLALDMEELLTDNGCEVVGRSDTVMEAFAWLDRETVDIALWITFSKTGPQSS
jgi:two-component SAPR family response regulator